MYRALIRLKPAANHESERLVDDWRAKAVCIFLVVAVALVFGQALGYGFSNFDDGAFVCQEPHVKAGLSWSGLRWAFTHGPLGEWYPLAMLSHMLDCQYFGMNPAGHHLTSLMLHAASALLLFLVLWRMTEALWASALVAALFALHPLRVESVVWISERRDVLSGFFFMLTLAAYVEYARHPRSLGRYLAVVVWFTLGLLTKAILVTVPAVLLLLDFWPLGKFHPAPRGGPLPPGSTVQTPRSWRLIVEKLLLLALAIAVAVVTVFTHPAENGDLSGSERLSGAAIALVAYIWQLFVPVGLSILYLYPEAGYPTWQIVGAAALLLAITAAAVIGRRSYPYFFVGWFWYVAVLIPVLGVVPLGSIVRADRYTYLSQIGLDIALVWGARRLAESWPTRRWLFGAGSAVVLAALMACTWRQVRFWQHPKTLWDHALECDPESPVVRFSLGCALLGHRNYVGAATQFRQVVELPPGHRNVYVMVRAAAHDRLGLIAAQREDDTDAIEHFERSLELNPSSGLTHVSLGRVLAKTGDFDGALAHLRRSVELQPGGNSTAFDRALDLARQGKTDEAIANFCQAFATDSDLGFAQMELATTFARQHESHNGSSSPGD
jgi:tetratricopeptide (TPR) repeat protein